MKHFRYCSEYFDEESGLTYLRNRYYDPSIGAFISEDSIKDGLNWYSYCGGNPVAFVDPLGLGVQIIGYDRESSVNDEKISKEMLAKLTGLEYNVTDNGMIEIIEGSEINGGSETARALVETLIKDPNITVCIQFSNDTKNDEHDAYYDGNNIKIGSSEVTDEFIVTFIHELTHAYTDKYGYNDSIIMNFVDENDPYRNQIEMFIIKKYQEATAITVEEAVRKELNMQSREVAGGEPIGVNKYGQFPAALTTNPNEYMPIYGTNSSIRLFEHVKAYTWRYMGSDIANTIKSGLELIK